MNDQSPVKRPGEVWWAYHPWLSRVEFWNKNGSKVTTRSLHYDNPSHVHIECKKHPALILAPGDEKGRGYLVCYLSGQSDPDDPIPRRPLNGVTITTDKFGKPIPSFVFSLAPCYCDDEFIWGQKPIRTVHAGALDMVKGILKRACLLYSNQNWSGFSFRDIEPDIPVNRIEDVRTCVRELIDAIRHVETPLPEIRAPVDRADSESQDFNNEFNDALATDSAHG
jgi:hypothetical protein